MEMNLFSGNLKVINVINLPHNFVFSISDNYLSGNYSGQLNMKSSGSLDIGIRKKLNNGKDTFTLTADDVLGTDIWEADYILPGGVLSGNMIYDWHIRAVRLTYSHTFGNTKIKSVKVKSGAEDERNRVNGG